MFKLNFTDRWLKKAAQEEGEHDITAGPDAVAQTLAPSEPSEDGGSTYKVPMTTILEINAHTNAERLELATVYGFQVIVRKGQYKVGDRVIYVPIDSLLPQWLEDQVFPPDSKVKLHHHRVRQIRLRGLASQGMLLDPTDVAKKVNPDYLKLEQDLAAILGVTKYEPPQRGPSSTQAGPKNRNKKHEHPLFHKYNGLSNIKWFPTMFKEGDQVVLQEKMHGTNARASVLPYAANTWKKKLKKLFGLAPKTENCYGSNNVDISSASDYKGFYGEDVYGKTFADMDVFSKLKSGEIVYGEIIGPGIQKGYEYDLTHHEFLVFDVKVIQADGKFRWLNPAEVIEFCKDRGFNTVPQVYVGPYNKELTYSLTKGASLYDPKSKVREGVVIKAAEGYDVDGNKKALKWVSEDYLADVSNTDFH